MSNFIGRPPSSNSLWVGIETMQFHIAQTKLFFEDTLVSHPGGPNEQFGTHEKLSWGGGGVQGNLNWMLGYITLDLRFENLNPRCTLIIQTRV